MRLSRGALRQLAGTRALSTAPSAQHAAPVASSSSSTPSTSSSSSSSASSSSATPAEVESSRPPILPFFPIPRPPNFPGKFRPNNGEYPTVNFVNFPYPLWKPTAAKDLPKDTVGGDHREKNQKILAAMTGLEVKELNDLRRMLIKQQRVSHMTKKGRMRGMVAWMLVGDPNKGLVGLGRGAAKSGPAAVDKAFYQACKNMDYVDRYENRTLWGSGKELRGKFESSVVHLRARPPGFGLFVPHSVHKVLSMCGIKDASAMIVGSTHLVNVTKCVIQMLHGGANPPGFGSGFSTAGKVENKGHGMRTKTEIERARGRYGVNIGRQV
ncbi:hypothetical protein BD324DRAFT_576679 [Kockovaella imperatae]|uniref:S5 DRBM domain-containing protein n=1 Tax=Kockovaella imperatae TaxID=4999 RepID=A0A1Y1UMU9_9TREE|nr:hypothetical protein BD324DRAFT_576679 [Kockovaella imperatae]ORX39383.1 hypothetical protein BD324DRAFT_576679 [Kockovaella imperatae]